MKEPIVRLCALFDVPSAKVVRSPTSGQTIGGTKFQEFCTGYDLSNLNIPFLSDDLFFFTPSDVRTAQLGYAVDAISGEPLENWLLDATCFSFHGGDPFFVFNGKDEIYWARHGLGHWNPILFANNIDQFLSFCAAWAAEYQKQGDGSIWTDDFELKEEFVDSLFADVKEHGFEAEPLRSSLIRML